MVHRIFKEVYGGCLDRNFSGDPMWNVSGVTGAAPIWVEMMDFLHRDVSSIQRKALSGSFEENRVLPGRGNFQRGMVYRGTEPSFEVREQASSTQE